MVEIKNLKIFNDIDFIAHSARVSGVSSDMSDEEMYNLMVKNNYGSTLEHIIFTYEIWELSKGNSPELLEHRMASHTGRSTRYIKENNFDYNIPPKIKSILNKYNISEKEYKHYINGENPYLLEDKKDNKDIDIQHLNILYSFSNTLSSIRSNYNKLLFLGLGKENSRYITPFAMHTGYTYTENLRSVINKLGLRLCCRASPEMQEYAIKLFNEISKKNPLLLEKCWCRGFNNGVCPENEVRDSPQGKRCPFKNSKSDIYIPTADEVRNNQIPINYKGFKFNAFKLWRNKKIEGIINK